MRFRFHTCTRFGALALLVGLVGATTARAQDELDETPAETLADDEEPTAEPTAETSSDTKDQEARELFEKGRAAYEDGNYRDAWDYFRQAFLLSKRPELLYNVGQAADRLRMDREAVDAFKLYVKRRPDADNRREVENRIRALQEQLGEDPADAVEASETVAMGGDSPKFFGDAESDAAVPAPKSKNGQPERTGLYVRLALGLGVLQDSISDSATADSLGSPTTAAHLAVGYDLGEGIVLGGGLIFEWGISPSVSKGSADSSIRSANLTLLTAFIDYYLQPRENGWHLLGGLGVGSLSLSDTTGTVEPTAATAAGFVMGGGYEWPLDSEWALGVLGRLTLARAGQDTATHGIGALSVAFTGAWY
jgi:hypothetical protein